MAYRRRLTGITAVGFIAALLLIAAPLAQALKAPGLASSAQYKAFIEYVKKMDGLAATPASTETKNAYEAKLTAKKTAAAHKANALFKRASEEAQAEANEEAKAQVTRVKAKETEEREALSAQVSSKFERIESSYHSKFERIVRGHHKREAALKAQIGTLREQKAATPAGPGKESIQARIEKKSGEVAANRADEAEKRKGLKAATAKQKSALKATSEEAEGRLAENARATIQKIQNHWSKAYEEKKAALNTTRENRLDYLETKLEQGRADIAAMPATP
jgi:hypothetical protein